MKLLLTKILLLVCLFGWSQEKEDEFFSSENIADASGAAEILNNGVYHIEFTGSSGFFQDINQYKELVEIQEKNSLFFKYTAPFDGSLSLEASVNSEFVQLAIFKNVTENVANDVLNGKAILLRSFKSTASHSIALSIITGMESQTPLELKKDETILLAFNTLKKGDRELTFNIKFELSEEMRNAERYKKIVDERKDSLTSFVLKIRDAETGFPVVADINIKGKKQSNLYAGSDLLFNVDKSQKLNIKCDAPGYFFNDKDIAIHPDSTNEILIEMRPISQGKTLKMDKIEFVKGTADLVPGAENTLNRVKDFLLLNSNLRIEVQGHVNNEGDDNVRTNRLSKRRARKVMNYFVQSGIKRKRLTYKGYGSKFPVYPKPKTAKEDQANRRVEIKIL
ncbi:MAG: OmpA family protein [Crocinitomicaceae bacterium]|nr:MAG: OmpA family protein [Crocinitomicaceae bacterium]